MVPTAEELAKTIYQPIGMTCNEFAIELAKKLTKLHCIEQAKVISQNVEFVETTSKELNSEAYQPFITADDKTIWTINKESIINAYNLNLIK